MPKQMKRKVSAYRVHHNVFWGSLRVEISLLDAGETRHRHLRHPVSGAGVAPLHVFPLCRQSAMKSKLISTSPQLCTILSSLDEFIHDGHQLVLSDGVGGQLGFYFRIFHQTQHSSLA